MGTSTKVSLLFKFGKEENGLIEFRVPVDKSTLQPGRRASKAGLESLRTLSTLTSAQSSPHPSPSAEGRSLTPSANSRVGRI